MNHCKIPLSSSSDVIYMEKKDMMVGWSSQSMSGVLCSASGVISSYFSPPVPQHPSTINCVYCSICLNFCMEPEMPLCRATANLTSLSSPSRCCATPQALSRLTLIQLLGCPTGFIKSIRREVLSDWGTALIPSTHEELGSCWSLLIVPLGRFSFLCFLLYICRVFNEHLCAASSVLFHLAGRWTALSCTRELLVSGSHRKR